jgi:hypothetical protein
MKWISLSKSNAGVRVFNLIEDSKVKEVMRYNPLQQSLRLSSAESQRVFFIAQSGFRHNHFTFENEYGFETGRIYFDATSNNDSGIIEFEETKLQCSLIYNPLLELVIYEPGGLKSLCICELQPDGEGQINFSSDAKETLFGYACLLWAQCWHLLNASAVAAFANQKMILSQA